MENTNAGSVDPHLRDNVFSWQQSDDGLLAPGSTSTVTGDPNVHYQNQLASPVSSGCSSGHNDIFSFDISATTSASQSSSPKKRSTTESVEERASSSSSPISERFNKRQRNTEAARRYRQRKVDRLTEVEEALASMTKERDDLKLKLARSEAEADVLRGIVGKRV